MGVLGVLTPFKFSSFKVILLEPVHDGKKVEDRGGWVLTSHHSPSQKSGVASTLLIQMEIGWKAGRWEERNYEEDKVIASFDDIEAFSYAETNSEAINQLCEEIVEPYEHLQEDEVNLGPLPQKWLHYLKEIIECK